MEAGIRQLEANLDARVVTVVNRASVEEVSGWVRELRRWLDGWWGSCVRAGRQGRAGQDGPAWSLRGCPEEL